MRIIGIDLGSSSVKAVEIDSAFGRYEIHEYHEQKVEPGSSPLLAAFALLQGLPKVPDRIVVALRTGRTTFRNLTVPTRDKKAIQASVGFELEDELPFPADESVFDYSVQSQQGQVTHLHVAATLRKHVVELIDSFSAAGVEPDLITTETWAYRALMNRILSPAGQEQPVLLLSVGSQRTTFYVHHKGKPVLAREIAFGGQDITSAIAVKYNIPIDQAETAKLDHGFVLPSSQKAQATAEQVELSNTIMEPLEELLREVRQVGLSCKSLTHSSLSALYLAGGTSLLPGIGRMIEEEANIAVTPLQALSAIASSGVTYSEHTDTTFALASALSLCLVGPDRSSAINLRKGVLSKKGRSRDFNINALKGPLIALGVVTLSLFISLMVQSTVYQNKLKSTDAQLERSVKAFFGQVSGSAVRTYLSNTSSLRTSINKEINKQKELAKLTGINPHSPISFLKELSASVPRDVVVDMVQFQTGAAPTTAYVPSGDTTATLTFLVANPQMIEKLASLMDKRITGMTRSKTEDVAAPDGAGKRLKITFTGKVPEDSYGK